ncbi:MAG: HlyU family transcriptional regulator [Parvibaculaceae bacterium]
MSFLKSLFGLGGSKEEAAAGPAATAKEAEHKGFVIRATPYKDGGQYQTAGTIVKEIDGETKEYKFVRADRFSTLEEAADLSLSKGRQIVDEQGERMFSKG